MRFWKSPAGIALVTLALPVILVGAVATFFVCEVLQPERAPAGGFDFESLKLEVEPVAFSAADGVPISAWLFEGEQRLPPLILGHDLGSSKDALIDLATRLNARGFPVLAIDFRGHGESAGHRSTLGIKEKRDVIGAVDFLARRRGIRSDTVGVYGVGMGAHAAVLAGRDRPALRAMVLDGLYPDVSYPLVRSFYAGWDIGVERLGILPRGVFLVVNGTSSLSERAADVMPALIGRHLLLLAPAGDSELASEMQRMFEAVPDQVDADGNLMVLPATHSEGLYGENLGRHHARVVTFFSERLGAD